MTTDITELAQMKGQKVEGSYYLAECTDCGKMYPSNKLNGGEPLLSGDYGECYCPHCNADDAAIGDCGDTAAKAWNYQQARIDALVEALEMAQDTINEMDNRIRKQNRHICELFDDNKALRQRIAELESRAVKIVDCDFGSVQHMSGGSTDYCHGFVDGTQNAIRAISTAGIKVEAE